MMRLQHGRVVLVRGGRRAHIRLQTREERREDRAEQRHLLVRDLVQDRDERADCFEEVQLGREEGGGARGFGQDGVGRRFEGREFGGDVEEVLRAREKTNGQSTTMPAAVQSRGD
jgi:hypothetical protein